MPICKVCKKTYERKMEGQVVCGYECSLEYGKKRTETALKRTERENRSKRARDKKKFLNGDVTHLKKIAQRYCNEWIRTRDFQNSCCTCKRFVKLEAGHYRPATNSNLRYNTNQIFGQCKQCNQFLSSNAVKYRAFMVEKFGEERVSELDSMNGIKKFEAEYLIRLASLFRKKTKAFKKRHE